MVQFGKKLNEVVKSDWRCHAVAYIELKRTLSAAHCVRVGANATSADDDELVHSDHTETPYEITDFQTANFFRIYEDSVRRLEDFYESRVPWAQEERLELEEEVARRVAKGEDATTANLLHRVTEFLRDLDLVLEFLELNATAFSKILKKFDKRTGSSLRESKIQELKAQHSFLYDGGELMECKALCIQWIERLQSTSLSDGSGAAPAIVVGLGQPPTSSATASKPIEQQPLTSHMCPAKSETAATASTSVQHRRRKTDPRLRLNMHNSFTTNGGETKDSSKQKGIENPQESSGKFQPGLNSVPEHSVATPAGSEHGSGVGSNSINEKKSTAREGKRGSISTTKDSQILQRILHWVSEELCSQKADSPFFDNALGMTIPPPSFASPEVEYAGMLGRGEFCKIYEVTGFNVPDSCRTCFLHRGYNGALSSDLGAAEELGAQPGVPASSADSNGLLEGEGPTASVMPWLDRRPSNFSLDFGASMFDYDDSVLDQATRGFMKDHCIRNGEARYAIKRIGDNLVGEDDITDAAVDLAREAEFLAALKHPNIVRIRGTIGVPGHPKYSIILDRLYDTLEVQMKKWKVDIKRYQGKFNGLFGKNKAQLDKLWLDRLVAAYDLARAMAFLHSHGIVHRDIKPANIGFDIRGDIKIFDFGLAKELKPSDRVGEDQYHTDGMAGTRRYMAPEVAQIMPYGLSSDVYSFGILLWEMITLKAAYEKFTRERHYKEVVVEGKRPKNSSKWPFSIKNILERCWHKRPSERPTFQAVCGLIKFSMPEDVDASDRSGDLMLRSYKSTGHVLIDDSTHRGSQAVDDIDPDGLSRSIRVKNACNNWE